MSDSDIIMSGRKYQVFISSTFSDLARHRAEAVRAVVSAGHLPLALEYRTPESADKATVIGEAIKACQFYVLLLGHRYGSRPKGPRGKKKPSYVEMELDMAEKAGLKVVALLLHENLATAKRNKLRLPMDREERENEAAYWAFRRRFTERDDQYFYKPFRSPAQVFTELYAYFSREHHIPGYIPEPRDRDTSALLQVYTKNEVLRAIVKRLGKFGKVEDRLSEAQSRKEQMAIAFEQLHGLDVQNRFERIFFESGSTILYLAKSLAPRLPTRVSASGGRPKPTVITNNAFAYIYLWLCANVMCYPEPEGPPDEKYGGMFGPLTDLEYFPRYDGAPLSGTDPRAFGLVRKLSRQAFGPPAANGGTLILAAASGLQLTDEINAVEAEMGDPIEDAAVLKQVSRCRGLHVGSYRNRLFKRCLYLAGAPTIVFVHDSKVDCPIAVGKCHFIFDSGSTWKTFVKNHPLAFWIGCTRASHAAVLEKCSRGLRIGGWCFSTSDPASRNPIIIAHNKRFRDACKALGVAVRA
jgi:hypothetical protein